MRIAVNPVDEVHSRAAATMVATPLVSMVGLIGKPPPKTWGAAAMEVADGAGFDVLVGPDGDVTPDGSGPVCFAGLTGLARSLAAVRLDGPPIDMDRTVTAEPSDEGEWALFPAPLGAVRRSGSAEGVSLCPTGGTLAGVSVRDADRQIGMVDDVLFASGVCLAAGAVLAMDHRGPVWEAARAYLDIVEGLGLVFAEAITDGT